MRVGEILKKRRSGEVLSREELVYLLSLPTDAAETYMVMAEANRLSAELSGGKAEVHAQFALNLAPCPCDCLFCSFAKVNDVFHEATELTVEQAVSHARRFEADGANAIFIMSTAGYPFERFIEMGGEIRRNLHPATTLIANIGDQSLKHAETLRDAGFAGVYHALRLREGTDSTLSPEKRKESIRNFLEAGLEVGTCVEPVGPEHTNGELAEMIEFTASFNPAYSGAARRIPIPGTAMARRGLISELRMAQIVAVTRLGMPDSVTGNCTHEPCTLGAIAGANLFWAEVGANPRDVEEKTEEGRGETVDDCRAIFHESGREVLDGPSLFYNRKSRRTR
ncbi:radical SAM protein [Prosthecochloris sp. GSB1]|uniref:radical SAM protein n=1 Tax=Prosthecochloris sp. GSB1 TaxID=281093 RepID=UPI000B8CF7A7|nr:radical SAM protein [Prosthecochloris sp. GSB1]ASQ89686.1 radical SAM protein [Prosthecochloris sp. GSB1]